MIMRFLASFAVAAAVAPMSAMAAPADAASSDMSILSTYAEDYRHDPTFADAVMFGVKIADEFYTVDVTPEKSTVKLGEPATPSFYFTIENSEYLQKLDKGEYAALTLMGKAFSTDVTPMDMDVMEGFQPDEDFGETILPFIFHFWTRGTPELVKFSADATRVVHGANLGVFYYQPGLRSGWFDIRPGQHVNEDEDSRTNPFPSMFVLIDGSVEALIGDEAFRFEGGNMMFVPAGVSHQFINRGDAPAFGFLFMFGDGA